MNKMSILIQNINSPDEASKFAYDTIKKYLDNIPPRAKVLIKPNITAPMSPQTGATTHHELVMGVLDALAGLENVMIIESDATSSDFEENILGWGCTFLYDYPHVSLVNLSNQKTRKIRLEGSYNSYEIEIPELLLDYDVLINLPVMKTHILTGLSLGIKNLFGLLPDKNKAYHHIHIHDLLFAIYKRFQPDVTILDGIQGMKGMGPIFGESALARMVLASHDIVALDAIAARIMGFDPCSIGYLDIAMSQKSCYQSFRNLHFKSVPTLPTQIIRAFLILGSCSLDAIIDQIDAPLQTRRHLPSFIDALTSAGVILNHNSHLRLNSEKLDILFHLFPETERELSEAAPRNKHEENLSQERII